MDLSSMVPDRVPTMGSDRSVAPSGVDPQNHPESSPLSLTDLPGTDALLSFALGHRDHDWHVIETCDAFMVVGCDDCCTASTLDIAGGGENT